MQLLLEWVSLLCSSSVVFGRQSMLLTFADIDFGAHN